MNEPVPAPPPNAAYDVVAGEVLPTLVSGLLRLEDRAEDSAIYELLFDGWNRLRAAAVASGDEEANRVCLGCVRALYAIRKGHAVTARPLIDGLLAACDWLTEAAAGAGRRDHGDAEPLLDRLTGALREAREPAPDEPLFRAAEPVWPPPARGLAADALQAFRAEGADHLAEAEAALLALEDNKDNTESMNRLFRAVHSLKGGAGFLGLAQLGALSHRIENLLELARAGRLEWGAVVADLILRGVDELKDMVHRLAPDGECDRDLTELLAALDAAAASPLDPVPEAFAPRDEGAREEVFRRSAAAQIERVITACRAVAAGDASEAILTELRDALATLHGAADYMGREDLAGPAAEVLTAVDALRASQAALRERLTALFGTEARGDVPARAVPPVPEERPRPAPPRPADRAPEPAAAPRASTTAPTMRIDQHKLDEYVNLAGELVIARNALVHVFTEFQAERGPARQLKECVEKVGRIVGDIQNNAMSMRMVPVNTLFQRFPRLIRDLSKGLGKTIELRHFGGETELDKQVAEALADPLVHLIRNSADHGIERPEVRQEAGKPEAGTITLRAGREGNTIVIDVIDDGAGIDTERLKAKAIENGVLTVAQAERLSEAEAQELVFAPGLSTAKAISDVSGRGVGMDVVRSNVAALGGSVSVTSERGVGTRLRLQLPLTLAVSNVILVGSAGHTYAVPLECVKETVKVPRDEIKRLMGQQAISLRGEVVVLKSLRELLAGPHGPRTTSHWGPDTSSRVIVIVVGVGGVTYGITVDELLGQQEMVIKPMPGSLGSLPGLDGATITGDGSVVLILDPQALFERASSLLVRDQPQQV